MTGWRVGFAAGPAPLVKAMATVQSQSVTSVCSIAQAATVAALTGPQDDVPRFREAFERRRDLVVEGLRGINGLTLSPPDGAFYGYIGCASLIGRKTPDGTLLGDDTAVAAYLLHGARVASVPGTAFGQSPYIRISTATSDGADRGRGADDRRRGERGVTHAALRTHPDHRRGRPPRHPTAPRPRRPFETLAENEEQAVFDLADMEATIAACEGCDAIVHFGGASREAPWQTILDASIRGS